MEAPLLSTVERHIGQIQQAWKDKKWSTLIIWGTIIIGLILSCIFTLVGTFRYAFQSSDKSQSFARATVMIEKNYGPINQVLPNEEQNKQVDQPREDTFFLIRDGKYPEPKLKLFLSELSTSTSGDLYRAKITLVIGVAAGAMKPIVNSVVAPPDMNCELNNIPLQPAVAVGGELVGRVIYSYGMQCASSNPFEPNNFGKFNFNYAY
ncbi:MAG: hypothetical protein A2945_04315 [Candidatus Liptonbacteria bacterium RIFCSPLOWO2_01_FULL_52_25]|uniref:Uncharacterized protein n=1 Tax=Candidatus Liptonbacteria bacterium RIFCSPLOWO2_01_FULL_52_25 TaxID=1798650 RepID=A0A1G2CFR1_9BACT|nr:MAG: hypothetical protein A2945_04315 [Candidatus Liptonbacteria bacterium RIFCSPLOWO2_01_FULL_52_25]